MISAMRHLPTSEPGPARVRQARRGVMGLFVTLGMMLATFLSTAADHPRRARRDQGAARVPPHHGRGRRAHRPHAHRVGRGPVRHPEAPRLVVRRVRGGVRWGRGLVALRRHLGLRRVPACGGVRLLLHQRRDQRRGGARGAPRGAQDHAALPRGLLDRHGARPRHRGAGLDARGRADATLRRRGGDPPRDSPRPHPHRGHRRAAARARPRVPAWAGPSPSRRRSSATRASS